MRLPSPTGASATSSAGSARTGPGRAADAEACYRQAVAGFTGLVAAHPDRPAYRHDLATAHQNLGLVLRDDGRTAEAEAAYEQAVALWQRLTKECPARPVYRQGQG